VRKKTFAMFFLTIRGGSWNAGYISCVQNDYLDCKPPSPTKHPNVNFYVSVKGGSIDLTKTANYVEQWGVLEEPVTIPFHNLSLAELKQNNTKLSIVIEDSSNAVQIGVDIENELQKIALPVMPKTVKEENNQINESKKTLNFGKKCHYNGNLEINQK